MTMTTAQSVTIKTTKLVQGGGESVHVVQVVATAWGGLTLAEKGVDQFESAAVSAVGNLVMWDIPHPAATPQKTTLGAWLQERTPTNALRAGVSLWRSKNGTLSVSLWFDLDQTTWTENLFDSAETFAGYFDD